MHRIKSNNFHSLIQFYEGALIQVNLFYFACYIDFISFQLITLKVFKIEVTARLPPVSVPC